MDAQEETTRALLEQFGEIMRKFGPESDQDREFCRKHAGNHDLIQRTQSRRAVERVTRKMPPPE